MSSWICDQILLNPINRRHLDKSKSCLNEFEQLFRKKPMKKVSKLKEIFKNIFALKTDKDVVIDLIALIE